MAKKQRSRGRANRRYQAARKDFRKRPIPAGWSKLHKEYSASLSDARGDNRRTAIEEEVAAVTAGPDKPQKKRPEPEPYHAE